MITGIEDHFTRGCDRCDRFATPDCATRFWTDGLNALPAIARGIGLTEPVKWGHPCDPDAGRDAPGWGAKASPLPPRPPLVYRRAHL